MVYYLVNLVVKGPGKHTLLLDKNQPVGKVFNLFVNNIILSMGVSILKLFKNDSTFILIKIYLTDSLRDK